jgi:hypothetical protein
MLTVFEVHYMPGVDASSLLSEEVQAETMAQIMTAEEARAVGFQGGSTPSPGRALCFIAVAPRDARFVQNRLDAHEAVTSFAAHEVET